MSALEDLTRNYRAAFLRYLPRHEEEALTAGYALGRRAVAGGTSLLDLVRVHHDVLLEVLRESRPDELGGLASAASDFLIEVLSTYDMTQRGLLRDAGTHLGPRRVTSRARVQGEA